MTARPYVLAPLFVLCLSLTGCPRSHGAGEEPTPRADGGSAVSDGGTACAPAPEVCNGRDDDCDGSVDEGVGCEGRPCGAEQALCDGECVFPAHDEQHCGGCGRACDAGEQCLDRVCCTPTSTEVQNVDLLFVVDDSNSMEEEQASLIEQIPRLTRILATGDRDGDGERDFVPPRSVQAGVITTDMGTGGHPVPTCEGPDFGDDGVLRIEGATRLSGCLASYPSYLVHEGGDVDAFALDLSCLALAGANGCGIEQPLESMLKAVTPSSAGTRFAFDSRGHGDTHNEGFLRRDALLAVIVLTDEDDCSLADAELVNPMSVEYPGPLSLRCFTYPSALHRIDRFVRGLVDVKGDPSRILFSVIGGVPPDLVAGGSEADYDALLSDERMEETLDPSDGRRLRPSCDIPGRGLAFPPRRLVRTAQRLDAAGASTVVSSICQEDLSPAVTGIAEALELAEPVFGCEP